MKKTAFVIALLLFQLIGRTQTTGVLKNRMDTLASIINSKKVSVESVRDSLRSSPAYFRLNFTIGEASQLNDLMVKRFGPLTLEQEYYTTMIYKECLSENRYVGKALIAIDDYVKRIKKAGNQKALAKAYSLYIAVYSDLDFPEERLKYARLYFYNMCKVETDPERINDLESGYSWDLSQVGWALRKNEYLDSAAILMKKTLAYNLAYNKDDITRIGEGYGILLLTLARLKRYEEIIPIAKEGIRFENNFPESDPGKRRRRLQHYVGDFNLRIGSAFVGLKNRDSAFYYFNLPERFETEKAVRNTWYPAGKKYYVFEHLFEMVYAHVAFEEYKQAAGLLDVALFSKDRLTDTSLLGFLFERAAPIFDKAGLKEKAITCYREAKLLNDIMQKQQEKLDEEARLTATRLQIQVSEENAILEKEKIQLQVTQEKKQKNIILIASVSGAFMLVVFIVFIYNRFRVARKQKNIIALQKHLVEEKNMEITQSIEYALRIQTAILPPQKTIRQNLAQSFVLYKPKDIVAGDFYWMETTGDLVLFAACDCTGHGVPGAMVSVVCHNALNRAVREFGLRQPAAILDKTAELVIEDFSKSEESIKDGMDISLCAFNTKTKSIQWAGANNPLWIVKHQAQDSGHGHELVEYKANKQPIGMSESRKPFTNHTFDLTGGETIYLFTDGFADQFGGETRQKKLTKSRFKELLLSIQHLSLPDQGMALNKFMTNYRKDVEQLDDILVIGVKIG